MRLLAEPVVAITGGRVVAQLMLAFLILLGAMCAGIVLAFIMIGFFLLL